MRCALRLTVRSMLCLAARRNKSKCFACQLLVSNLKMRRMVMAHR